ncbi:hypothetical protein IQ249_25350 [Lusitaniella coriacea LEGE 07157]|uniref:Uncharacterized protein n=1 Tax=Lusitaniella coriacea LEGE 07157 TaxID=945747 RepID=A0A8J7E142_9CYAN|nr:hypothetical protein [Lusitaniella coriacea]MBE9119180.1 hypothetical protein [Lusitaniella coriacea LEGE 07157]
MVMKILIDRHFIAALAESGVTLTYEELVAICWRARELKSIAGEKQHAIAQQKLEDRLSQLQNDPRS